jgi:hypothetical protein
MRACYIELLLISWVSAVSAQTGPDALTSQQPPTDGGSSELSNEQLQYSSQRSETSYTVLAVTSIHSIIHFWKT